MFNILKPNRIFQCIFIINILFFFIKAKTEKNHLENETLNFTNLYETTDLEIIIGVNCKSKIEAKVEGDGDFSMFLYTRNNPEKDCNYTNNRNFIQNFSYKKKIWFNKISNNLTYCIRVECIISPCNYNLVIQSKDELVMNPNEIYSYYVSSETVNMNFFINKIEDKKTIKKPMLSIWAKGNKNITSNYTGNNYENETEDNLASYIVDMPNDNSYFSVTGNLGDFINVGVLLFDDKICKYNIENLNGEISLLFIKNHTEFCFPNKTPNIVSLLEYGDNNYSNLILKTLHYIDNNYYCLKIDNTNYIYTFQYNNITNIAPLMLGATYTFNISNNQKIGLIPMILDKNFKYLTYQFEKQFGICEYSILNCNNYPICDLNNKNKTKLNSTYFTFMNKEYKEYISLIDKDQKVLLIECKNESCSINVNFYTDKKTAYISTLIPFQKYLYEKIVDNFRYFKSTENSYLYIESLSGDIEDLSLKEIDVYEKIDKKTILKRIEDNKLNFAIKVGKNIAYSIGDVIIENNNNYNITRIKANMNYRIKLYNKNKNTTIKIKDMDKNNETQYFISFYSLKCRIEVNHNIYPIYSNKTKENKIFQYYFDNITNSSEFYVSIIEDDTNCKDNTFDISLFKYDSLYNIFLSKDKTYKYIFSNHSSKIKYKYYITDIHKDLKINLLFSKKINFSIFLYLNEKNISDDDDNYFLKEKTRKIESKKIKKNCKNEIHPCIVVLEITLQNLKENDEEDIEVTISDESNSTIFYIICSVVGAGVLLIVIIIIIICICKNGNYLNKLKNEINTISFKDEDESQNRESKEDDDLLY